MIKQTVGPFSLYKHKGKKNFYGFYYDSVFDLPFAKDRRHVRVWLPEDYDFNDPNKRFPVIYFSDGQNLIDSALAAFGIWEFDKCVHKKKLSVIAVGIDCPRKPKQRSEELNPPFVPDFIKERWRPEHPFGDVYVDYMADTIKPLIDSLFYTKPEKEWTGIGGSSMGGLMSFYAYMRRSEVFGFALSFSPAFFLYKEKTWMDIMHQFDLSLDNKVFLYVGGSGFEASFTDMTKKVHAYLKGLGMKEDKLKLIVDMKNDHNEASWAQYLGQALSFWLEGKK